MLALADRTVTGVHEQQGRYSVVGLVLCALSVGGIAILLYQPDAWYEAHVYGMTLLAGIGTAGTVVIWRSGTLSIRALILGAIAFRIALLPVVPLLSDDVYRYLWDGVLQLQGINPYESLPSDERLAHLHDSVLFEEMNSPEFFSVYPPLSQVFFAIGALAYPLGWEAAYYLLKVLFVGIEMGGVVALASLVKAHHAVLYAWNPLVVIEVAGQAHTEAVMVGLLLGAVWAVHHQRIGLASVLVAGAGMAKLYPFALLGLLFVRYGWRGLWPGLVLALSLGALYLRPSHLTNMLESLELYVSYFEFNAGLYFLLKEVGWIVSASDPSSTVAGILTLVAAVAVCVVLWLMYTQRFPTGAHGFAIASYAVIATYILTATTVHPWYLLGLLALLPLLPSSHFGPWLWLSVASLGTYARYVDGAYWLFVWISWLGFAAFTLAILFVYRDRLLSRLMRYRAERKAALITRAIEQEIENEHRPRILDLGAGEGYVGQSLQAQLNADVVLADVRKSNKTTLPFLKVDGVGIPLEDQSVDITVVVFVLHHVKDPEQLIQEAKRVTSGPIVVVESTCEGPVWCWLLERVDRFANWLRSDGAMGEQVVHFRSPEEWLCMMRRGGWQARILARKGSPFHRVVLLRAERLQSS